MKSIMVVSELEGSHLAGYSRELISYAKSVAQISNRNIIVVVEAERSDALKNEMVDLGSDRIVFLNPGEGSRWSNDNMVSAVFGLAEKYQPELLLFSATARGREIAPQIAARLETGLTADCTNFIYDESTDNYVFTRPTFGGKLMARIVCKEKRPAMGTIRPGAFGYKEEIRTVEPIVTEEIFEYDVIENIREIKLLEKIALENDIEKAKIVISVGMGASSPEAIESIQSFAKEIGAIVGCSRKVVENGILPYSCQVGQSGKIIAPNLYIACGISGAIQHLVGIEGAGKIIAINSDPEAPILRVADYGIIGDVTRVIDRFRKSRGCRSR